MILSERSQIKNNNNVVLWRYEEIIVNLLVIGIVFCFVQEFLSFRDKYWSVCGWNDRSSGFALK